MSDRRILADTRHSDRRCEAPQGGAIKIAMFVSNYLPHPGGLEVMVWNLARGLARRHDVVLVTSAYHGVHGVSDEDGMTVHRLPALHVTERLSVPYPVPLGPGVRAAVSAARGADIVHAHGALYLQTLLARGVSRRERVPFVLTEHVGFVEYASASLNAIQRSAWRVVGDPVVRGADAVVALGARVHDWLADRLRPDVRFVGNGVDLCAFQRRALDRRELRRSFGLPEEGTLVLWAGREAAKKNLDLALAIPRDDFTLVVCGWKRDLVGERLVDLGNIPHQRMAALYGCADIMLHTATGEGFPLAVQESVASGLPVVLLWDESYARWMRRDVVAAVDRPANIGPTLVTLVNDPDRREQLAQAGRTWAEAHWSWEATVAAYEEIYRDVIDRPRGR
jgi:glycosyltransferase involved in cell wall biosynthesis